MTDTHTIAHIPDEAVQAAKKAVSERCKRTYLTSDQMFAALAAALPHLSAPCAVEVMELNWVEVSYGFIAHTAFGTYKVKADVDQFMMINSGSEFPTSYHDNHFEAKAAAQADFERRILSCVVTKPVDVAAVQEQCAQIAENFTVKDHIAHDMRMGIFPEQSKAGVAIAAAIRALSAEPAQGEQWQPTHRHVKRGTEYQRLGDAQVQCEDGLTDYELATVYVGSDGGLWVRRKSEFEDGRFAPLPAAPITESDRAALAQGGGE